MSPAKEGIGDVVGCGSGRLFPALVQYVTTRPGPADRLRELYAYRELVANLTVRDLKLKYKGSILGVGWSLVNPILQMLIYTAVFSVFLRIVSVPHYWAFVIGGILVWTFFNSTLIGASTSFTRNPHLISKVYFPIEALPISMVLANFVNFLIPLGFLLVVLIIGGIPLGWSLVLLPVIALGQLALCIGCALAIASLTVFLRDIEHFLMLGLQVVFYLTPILYPLNAKALPRAATRYLPLLHLNPLAWYLESYHAILYEGHWPNPTDFALMILCSLLVLAAGFMAFVRLRPRLPEAV
jgi:lipopolysaccharide transport system permease protein